MWSDDDVVHRPKRVVWREWFWVSDIQSSKADLSSLQRINEGVRIDAPPTSDGDDTRTWLHERERVCIEESVRFIV
jgi:hypothetical protein